MADRGGDALHADALAVERDGERRRARSRSIEDEPTGDRAAADGRGEGLHLEPAALEDGANFQRLKRYLVREHEPAGREVGVGVELAQGLEREGGIAEHSPAVAPLAFRGRRLGKVDLRRRELRLQERPRAIGRERGPALDRALAEGELERIATCSPLRDANFAVRVAGIGSRSGVPASFATPAVCLSSTLSARSSPGSAALQSIAPLAATLAPSVVATRSSGQSAVFAIMARIRPIRPFTANAWSRNAAVGLHVEIIAERPFLESQPADCEPQRLLRRAVSPREAAAVDHELADVELEVGPGSRRAAMRYRSPAA